MFVVYASLTDPIVEFATSVVADLGLPGVFVLMLLESACIPIPSEATMLFAGFNVSKGEYSLIAVTLVGSFANLVGSWIAYAVGYYGRVDILEKHGRKLHIKPEHLHAADRYFEKHGDATVFFTRMLPIIRTFISLPAGVARMPFWRFTVLTFLGCLPWVFALTFIGQQVGVRWEDWKDSLHYVDYFVAACIVAGVAYLVIRRRRGGGGDARSGRRSPPPMAPPAEPRLRTRDAIALGLLHGPAELLPVSSSGHVALIPWLLGWPYSDLDGELRKAFEVALHAGTAAALIVGLRDEVVEAARGLDRRRVQLVVLSFLPPAIVGLALERPIERHLGTPATIAAGLVAGSIAMAAADATGTHQRRRDEAGAVDALMLGIAQACALIPGVSRNGATLAAGRLRGFAREDSNALSRHVALPVIVGATVLKGTRLLRRGLPGGTARAFLAGTVASFASTLASIRIIRQVERDRSLMPYAAYRLGLAGVVLARLRRGRADGLATGSRTR